VINDETTKAERRERTWDCPRIASGAAALVFIARRWPASPCSGRSLRRTQRDGRDRDSPGPFDRRTRAGRRTSADASVLPEVEGTIGDAAAVSASLGD
jgi:hypothetical protein